MSDISNDIETLKKLIVNAGQAATNLGPFVSTNKAAVHFTLNSRDKSATKSEYNYILYTEYSTLTRPLYSI